MSSHWRDNESRLAVQEKGVLTAWCSKRSLFASSEPHPKPDLSRSVNLCGNFLLQS